jgi:hypothetical protein
VNRVWIVTAGDFGAHTILSVHATPDTARQAARDIVERLEADSDEHFRGMAGTVRWAVWEVQP